MRISHRLMIPTLLIAMIAVGRTASFDAPAWAYPTTPREFQPEGNIVAPHRLAGSTRTYTYKQIRDTFVAVDCRPRTCFVSATTSTAVLGQDLRRT